MSGLGPFTLMPAAFAMFPSASVVFVLIMVPGSISSTGFEGPKVNFISSKRSLYFTSRLAVCPRAPLRRLRITRTKIGTFGVKCVSERQQHVRRNDLF